MSSNIVPKVKEEIAISLSYYYCYPLLTSRHKFNIISDEETIKRIIAERLLVSRFGDREYVSWCLCALGPTATMLAYDLFALGYQAIDIGHVDIEYKWVRKETKGKERVSG